MEQKDKNFLDIDFQYKLIVKEWPNNCILQVCHSTQHLRVVHMAQMACKCRLASRPALVSQFMASIHVPRYTGTNIYRYLLYWPYR